MKKIVIVVLVVAGINFAYDQGLIPVGSSVDTRPDTSASDSDSQWRSGSQVRGTGIVKRVLSDDNDGSRHQRFILRLTSGRTILIAHNIDLAPRVRSIAEGDSVAFFGQFESSPQGGVVHWTHKDPRGRHTNGWLRHSGTQYQ